MAVGIMVISTEGGRNIAKLITATPDDVPELAGAFTLPAFQRFGIDQLQAWEWLSKAAGHISRKYDEAHA